MLSPISLAVIMTMIAYIMGGFWSNVALNSKKVNDRLQFASFDRNSG